MMSTSDKIKVYMFFIFVGVFIYTLHFMLISSQEYALILTNLNIDEISFLTTEIARGYATLNIVTYYLLSVSLIFAYSVTNFKLNDKLITNN